jgi:histidinol-phosphate phosphatase family protein
VSAGAIFLDRDGTIIHDLGYVAEPDQVRLLPGALAGLRMLAGWGWRLVIVSNQSGIARGLYGQQAFHATMDRLHELLEPHGVRLLAAYYCPHFPDISGPCECRKPGSRMYQRAARDFAIELAASWFVGNRYGDVSPALRLGGKGVLVTRDIGGAEVTQARGSGIDLAHDLLEAARLIGLPLR